MGASVLSKMGEIAPEQVLDMPPEDFCVAASLSEQACEGFKELRKDYNPEGLFEQFAASGVEIDSLADHGYPEKLRVIPDPPPVLFRTGGPLNERPAVAMVGSRKASASGLDVAREIAKRLGERGMGIVSGLALGVDAAAHEGALDADGYSIGVLGCGIDVTYPRRNSGLFIKMKEKGTVVSEYGLGEAPLPWRFPARNRIIAGLADVVVVVEAAEKSGALITAQHALDQGKEVWAVPGPVWAGECRGSNKLLRDGAGVLWDIQEFVDSIAPRFEDPDRDVDGNRPAGESIPGELPKLEADVLQGVNWEPTPVEVVAGRSGMHIKELLSTLVLLELKGYVVRHPGGAYARRSV